MFKEIKDIKGVCENIITRTGNIGDIAGKMCDLMENLKIQTEQKDSLNVTLGIRKELSNLFILNSNIEDNYVTLKKAFDNLKRLEDKG